MQDPNEDTEWNDILRSKGILPPKKEREAAVTEDNIVEMLDRTILEKTGQGIQKPRDLNELDLDELDELEDEEDERVLLEYREKRINELKALAARAKYGSVLEITAQDYKQEVNQAGDDVWVVLHLYLQGIPHAALINRHLTALATKFPTVKFIKSIATTCIPNYPEKNVPSIFVYYEGDLKKQFVGSWDLRGSNVSQDELEYILGTVGALNTTIKEDPKPKRLPKDKLQTELGASNNDWW